MKQLQPCNSTTISPAENYWILMPLEEKQLTDTVNAEKVRKLENRVNFIVNFV